MAADFNFLNQKVDLNNVSKHVKDFVANAAKQEGNKKKIDSQKEFELLSEYLAGGGFSLNKDELGYINGYMIEYQKTNEKQFVEEFVTENTKNEVKKIMKRMGDKKTIDTDEEAQALVTMLRNSHNELNASDISYIRSLLIKSGYFQYLEEKEPNVTVVNVIVNEEKNDVPKPSEENCIPESSTEPIYTKPQKITQKPQRKEYQKAKEQADRAEKEANRAKSEADRSAQEADRSAKEADRAQAEADRAKKEADSIKNAPKVSEKARAQGFGIASKIQEELHDTWTNNGTIKDELSRVNSSNAYSFVGKMLEVTDSHTVFGNIYKRVSSNDIRHVVSVLLGQAKNIGLENEPEYKDLLETYKFIKRRYVEKNPTEPVYDRQDIEQLNIEVKRLYNRMSKVYK